MRQEINFYESQRCGSVWVVHSGAEKLKLQSQTEVLPGHGQVSLFQVQRTASECQHKPLQLPFPNVTKGPP